ncbi:hypothetical protein CNMCM6805_010006 [Aspergillus fumigatiaffinis]|uniref:Myb-like domain-containing protein n=1 Tax=Aspergillus fumigatiaffinis TaxID=340414 RepID=A0A8H4M6U5_9EURO|nr:hypothetical protein CNMCM6805_010006 [Aspergillus fumigatiaffinis]
MLIIGSLSAQTDQSATYVPQSMAISETSSFDSATKMIMVPQLTPSQLEMQTPTETVFIQNAPAAANTAGSPSPLTHKWSSTGITKPRNAFDVAITNSYGRAASQPQAIAENNSLVTSDIPGTLETPLDLTNCSLSLSEPPAFEDFTTATSSTNEIEQGNALSSDILITIDEATPRHSLSPAAASESTSNASGSLSLCGDSQQNPDSHATHEPPCSPDQDRDPCLTTINATEQTKNPEAAKGKSTPSCQPYQSNARSSPEGSASITTPSVDRPESYPSIAMVVPAPPWMRGKFARATTRVAALTCKKQLRSSRDGDNHQDPEVSSPGATQQRPKKKSKPTAKSLRHSLDGSDPVPCDCSRAMHKAHGRAILTVESSGQKPAYYLTFVPDASPLLTQTPPADTSGKQRPYTSDENALLVRLKEREGMPWAEIAAHFPERSASSLQVHYSTKLRHKVKTRAERLRRRP